MSDQLFGRRVERRTLEALLEDAVAGRGRVIAVLGEAGIGKTTLVDAVGATASQRGFHVAWGRCTEVEAPPYWPWRQLLRQLGADTGALENPPAAIPRAELFARVAEQLGSLPDPALLALEDIHWADAASLALLRFIIDFAPGNALLLVVTARDDPLEATTPAATELLLSLPARVERLALGGLDPEAVGRVVATVLGHQPSPRLVRHIVDRTGGNPFFVREVARLQASRGTGAELEVPAGVRQVLERRLARLSQGCHALMAIGAVIGEPEPELIAAVADRPLAEVLRDLGEAVDARLVMPEGRGLRFVHALVREVVYDQQPLAWRGMMHRRVAEALEKRAGGVPAARETLSARLAAHWRRATGEDAAKVAAERALTAARDAHQRMGFEQAVRFYRWALEWPPEDEVEISIEMGEAQIMAGEVDAGRAVLREAAAAARDRHRPQALARAALALGTGVGGFEVDLSDERQIPFLEAALTGLQEAQTSVGQSLRAAVLARLSLATAWRRDEADRVELARDAIELARAADDPRTEVAALAAWCDARSGPDHVDERLEKSGEMIAAAERCGDPLSMLLGRRFRVVALAERGDLSLFDAEVAAYARIAQRMRLPLYTWLVPLWRGMRALMEGDFATVRRHLAEADELGARAGSANAAGMVQTQRLWLAHWAGERDEMSVVMQSLMGVFSDSPYNDAFFAPFLARDGKVDAARGGLRRATAGGRIALPHDAEYLTCLWSLVDAVILLDERDAAEPVYEALEPYAELWVIDGIGGACLGVVAHQLGRLAAYLGRDADARAWLDQALVRHREAGASLLVAETEAAIREFPAASAKVRDPVPTPPDEGALRRSGKVWHLRWRGVEVTVPDSKGMRDLAALLAAPDGEIHVLDLVEAAGGPPRRTAGGHAGEQLDAAARAAYRRRLAELDGELAEAEANADAGRIAALRQEQEFVAAELAGALGLGGRARTHGDRAERARTAVAHRLRTVVKAIAVAHPDLGRHLERSLQTGQFCAYRPERPMRWHVSYGPVAASTNPESPPA